MTRFRLISVIAVVLCLLAGIGLWKLGGALYSNQLSLRAIVADTGFDEAAELTEDAHDLLGGHRPAQRAEWAVRQLGKGLVIISVVALIGVGVRHWRSPGAPDEGGHPAMRDADWLRDRRN